MKKSKLLIVIILTFALCACGKKISATSPATFYNVLTDRNYTVNDQTQTIGYATKAYVVNENNLYAVFVEANNSYTAKGLFADQSDNIYRDIGADYNDKIVNGKTYATVMISSDEEYHYLVWTDKTYFYIKCPKYKKAEAEAIAKEIGYY